MLPDAQMWLSLSITIPLRSCLCMDTPPTSMAYFSTSRKPGVVLRVPATSPCQPAAAASARNREQRVAMPEARARQLRAGLSPRRRHLAWPLTTAANVTPSGPVEEKTNTVLYTALVDRQQRQDVLGTEDMQHELRFICPGNSFKHSLNYI